MFRQILEALGDFSERLWTNLLYTLQCSLFIFLLSASMTQTIQGMSRYVEFQMTLKQAGVRLVLEAEELVYSLTQAKMDLPKEGQKLIGTLEQLQDYIEEKSWADFQASLKKPFVLKTLVNGLKFKHISPKVKEMLQPYRYAESFQVKILDGDEENTKLKTDILGLSLVFFFFLCAIAFIFMGLTAVILLLVRRKRQEFAIHLLCGAKLTHLYGRVILQVMLILLPANLLALSLMKGIAQQGDYVALVLVDLLMLTLAIFSLRRSLRQELLLDAVKTVE